MSQCIDPLHFIQTPSNVCIIPLMLHHATHITVYNEPWFIRPMTKDLDINSTKYECIQFKCYYYGVLRELSFLEIEIQFIF